MIYEVSHLCHVVEDLKTCSHKMLANGYANSFELDYIKNPEQKLRWSKNWVKSHSLYLYTKPKQFPIELIKYEKSNCLDNGEVRKLPSFVVNDSDFYYSSAVYDYDKFKRFLLQVGFVYEESENQFLFYSRFYRKKIIIEVNEFKAENVYINEIGMRYPAFWVRSLDSIINYFPKGEFTEKFQILINGKLLNICLAKLGPDLYFEFLEL